jgi:hypothetical protein
MSKASHAWLLTAIASAASDHRSARQPLARTAIGTSPTSRWRSPAAGASASMP